jgi:phenylalanyl-tRNA synthetase alpha chain
MALWAPSFSNLVVLSAFLARRISALPADCIDSSLPQNDKAAALFQVAYTVPKLKDYSPAALAKAAAECVAACQSEAAEVRDDADLKLFRDRWMARKNGILTQINDLWLKGAPKDAKREAGIRVNELKVRITELVEADHVSSSTDSLTAEAVDITLPGIQRPIGAEHPVIKTMH